MRDVYGIKVSQETYSVLRWLVQNVPRGTKADLEVALSTLSIDSSDFVSSRQQLGELVRVLCAVTREDRQTVSDAIARHYDAAVPGKAADIRESLAAVATELAAQDAEELQAERTATTTPVRRTRRQDTQSTSHTQSRGAKLKYTTELSKRPYEQQIADCPQSFSKTLQHSFNYDITVKTLLAKEAKMSIRITASIMTDDIDSQTEELPFIPTAMCQCPPQLHLILAPVSRHVPPIHAKNNPTCQYAGQQIDIAYQNEHFDEPDVEFRAHEIHKWLQQYDSQEIAGLSRFPIYQLITKKPTPQGHSLLDLPGCYIPKQQVYESLMTKFRLMALTTRQTSVQSDENIMPEDEQLKVQLIDVLFELSKLKFFAPLQLYVDQTVYGNESRYLRFVDDEIDYPGINPSGIDATDNATVFLKAVGAGGGVRLQVHCARDVLRDEELRLSLKRYFAVKENTALFEAMQQYIHIIQQIEVVCERRQWMLIVKDQLSGHRKFSEQFKNTAQMAARDGFLLTFLKQEFQPLLEEISVTELDTMLRSGLRGYGELYLGRDGFILRQLQSVKSELYQSPKLRRGRKPNIDNEEAVSLIQQTPPAPILKLCGVLGQGQYVPQEHQFYNTIMSLVQDCGHTSSQASLSSIISSIPDFSSFMYNFLLQRYGDWQLYGLAGAGSLAAGDSEKDQRIEKPGPQEGRRRGRKARYGTLQGDTQQREALLLESRVRRIMAAEAPSDAEQHNKPKNTLQTFPMLPDFTTLPAQAPPQQNSPLQMSPRIFDFQQLQGLEYNLSASQTPAKLTKIVKSEQEEAPPSSGGYSDQDFQKMLCALNQMVSQNNEPNNNVHEEQQAQKEAQIPSEEPKISLEPQKTEQPAFSAKDVDDKMIFELIQSQTLQSPKFSSAVPDVNDIQPANGQDSDVLRQNTVYIKMGPCFYVNYVPFARFEPASYQAFDRLQQEKIYVETHDFIRRVVQESGIGLIDDEPTQLALRFVHQNPYFDQLAHGQRISQQQYIDYTIHALKINKQTFKMLEPLIYQVFNVDTLALMEFYQRHKQLDSDLNSKKPGIEQELTQHVMKVLAGPGPGTQTKEYEATMCARLPPKIYQAFTPELQRQVADLTYQFVTNLPPLSHKMHRESKRAQVNETQYRAPPGYDGFYGNKFTLLPNVFENKKPAEQIKQQDSFFTGMGVQTSTQVLRWMASGGDEYEQIQKLALERLAGRV